MGREDDFTEHWPVLADRLRRYLARRKVPPSIHDDVVQETGLRILLYWKNVDSRRPLWGLTRRIAGLVLWESYNAEDRSVSLARLPDVAAFDDVEQTALARVELERVSAALAELTDLQRRALLEVLGEVAHPVRSPDAMKMLRMRARRRLNDILGRGRGLVFECRGRFRDLSRHVSLTRARFGSDETFVWTAASGLVMAVLALSTLESATAERAAPGAIGTQSSGAAAHVASEDVGPAGTAREIQTLLRDELGNAARAVAERRKAVRGSYLAPLELAKALYRDATFVAQAPIERIAPSVQEGVSRMRQSIDEGARSMASDAAKSIDKIVRKKNNAVSSFTAGPARDRNRKR